MSLADKAETLRTQLGLEPGAVVGIIEQASTQLGLGDELRGMSLAAKADACLSQLGVTAPVVSAVEIVAEPVPVMAMAVEALPMTVSSNHAPAYSGYPSSHAPAVVSSNYAPVYGGYPSSHAPVAEFGGGHAKSPTAPLVQQMARSGGAASEKHMSAQRLELSLASHPSQAIVDNGTCFLPWVPCIPFLFCACFGDLSLGPEIKAMKVDWNPDPNAANLTYADGCGQHIHVGWGKYEAENEVTGFGCCCPTIENESFTLYSDGTIRTRPRPDLAIGLTGDHWRLCLVDASSPRRLVFKRVLDGR